MRFKASTVVSSRVKVTLTMLRHTTAMARRPGAELRCRVPYRIDISRPPHDALERLVQLGALDIEPANDGLAAILPDGVVLDAWLTPWVWRA